MGYRIKVKLICRLKKDQDQADPALIQLGLKHNNYHGF